MKNHVCDFCGKRHRKIYQLWDWYVCSTCFHDFLS